MAIIHDKFLDTLRPADRRCVPGGRARRCPALGLRPSFDRILAFRTVAFAIPAIQYLLYFVAVMWWSRVTWSVHLWTGAIAIAGAAGWLISYLVVAPGTARDAARDRPGLAEMTRPADGAGGRRRIGK